MSVVGQGAALDVAAIRATRARKSPGRRQAQARSGGLVEPVSGGFDHLCVAAVAVRESPEYGYLLFAKMLEQTLEPYKHLRPVQEALALGFTPLLRTEAGERVRRELGAQVLYPSGSTRKMFGVRFTIADMQFQYGLTSGARPGLLGDNDWADALCDLIDQSRPKELLTGPASRLARLTPLFSKLQKHLQQARTIVRTVEVPGGMDLNDPGGRAQWQALANAAESDYLATLNRLLTGVVYELKNNRYPRASGSLFPGYRTVGGKGPDRNTVRPSTDPDQMALVRRFIEMCAGPATEAEIAHELAAMGMHARSHALSKKGPLLVNEVDNPVGLVRTLFSALPLYLDGTFLFQHEMPLPNIDTFHGYAIHRVSPQDRGYFQHELDFGLPPGGWHDRELILAAIGRRLAPSKDGPPPTTKKKVKPLAGLVRWSAQGLEYHLLAKDAESYELRRRSAPPTPASPFERRVPFGDNDGDLVGRFSALMLHQAVAKLLLLLAGPLPSELRCPAAPSTKPGSLSVLEAQFEEATVRLDAARREVTSARNDGEADAYRALAREAADEAEKVRRNILTARATDRPLPGTTMDADRIAALIRILQELPGSADISVLTALRSVVADVRITSAEPSRPLAVLEMNVELRTNTGAIRTGRLRTPVLNRAVGGTPGGDLRREGFERRNRQVLQALLLEDGTELERRELWRLERFTGRSYMRRMAIVLEPLAGIAITSALVDCPILDVRRAALRPFLHHDLPLSDGFADVLEREIQAVYTRRGFSWTKGWCPGGMARLRQVLQFIDQYQTDPEVGVSLQTLARQLQMDETMIYRMAHAGPAPYGRQDPSPAPWYPMIEVVSAPGATGRLRAHARIRQCPHCAQRSLLQPLRVPEVAGYLLCANCRRAELSEVVYPDEFFLPWDGPQSLARREPSGSTQNRAWFSEGGRIIVGTTLCEVVVPSMHAPRRAN